MQFIVLLLQCFQYGVGLQYLQMLYLVLRSYMHCFIIYRYLIHVLLLLILLFPWTAHKIAYWKVAV